MRCLNRSSRFSRKVCPPATRVKSLYMQESHLAHLLPHVTFKSDSSSRSKQRQVGQRVVQSPQLRQSSAPFCQISFLLKSSFISWVLSLVLPFGGEGVYSSFFRGRFKRFHEFFRSGAKSASPFVDPVLRCQYSPRSKRQRSYWCFKFMESQKQYWSWGL